MQDIHHYLMSKPWVTIQSPSSQTWYSLTDIGSRHCTKNTDRSQNKSSTWNKSTEAKWCILAQRVVLHHKSFSSVLHVGVLYLKTGTWKSNLGKCCPTHVNGGTDAKAEINFYMKFYESKRQLLVLKIRLPFHKYTICSIANDAKQRLCIFLVNIMPSGIYNMSIFSFPFHDKDFYDQWVITLLEFELLLNSEHHT